MTREQLPESERDLFEDIEERSGRLNNILRMLAYHPLLLRRLLHLAEGLRHAARLNPRLRELAIPTVGRLSQCTYGSVHHGALAQRLGVRPEQIERLAAWESDPAFTAQERAIIRYAAEATQQVAVSTTAFKALREFLDAEQIIELVLNVAFYNIVVRIIVPLEVDLEPDAHENRYKLEYLAPERVTTSPESFDTTQASPWPAGDGGTLALQSTEVLRLSDLDIPCLLHHVQ